MTERQAYTRVWAQKTSKNTDGEAETHRETKERETGVRKETEDGISSETHTPEETMKDLRERPCGRSSFPKGGGVSLGPAGPGWTQCPGAGNHPWGPQDFLASEVSKVPFRLAT